MLNILEKHDRIAWDFDGTLVDGPMSAHFCDFIRLNPQKEHHIVTFRDLGMARTIPVEIEAYGLTVDAFKGIHTCPPKYWRAFTIARVNPHNWLAAHASGQLPASLADPDIGRYLFFKGRKAKELGCTVLVDDMADLVAAGCRHHGIEFIDVAEFGQP